MVVVLNTKSVSQHAMRLAQNVAQRRARFPGTRFDADQLDGWVFRTYSKHVMRSGASCIPVPITETGRKGMNQAIKFIRQHYDSIKYLNIADANSATRAAWSMVKQKHVMMAIDKNEPLSWYNPNNTGEENRLHSVRDYLAGTDEPVEKLIRRSWPETIAMADKWHAAMKEKKERIKFTDECPVYLDLGDYKWVYLKTPAEKVREGDAMGHCVGRGGYERSHIFSLRTNEGRPKITVEWRGRVIQAQMNQNRPVTAEFAPMLEAFVEKVKDDEEYRPVLWGQQDRTYVDEMGRADVLGGLYQRMVVEGQAMMRVTENERRQIRVERYLQPGERVAQWMRDDDPMEQRISDQARAEGQRLRVQARDEHDIWTSIILHGGSATSDLSEDYDDLPVRDDHREPPKTEKQKRTDFVNKLRQKDWKRAR